MYLKFVDRTWILLGRLIDKGNKEGTIKHIELPIKEWNMMVEEWKDLNPNIQEQYLARFKVEKGGVSHVVLTFLMDEDFVDKWVEDDYTVSYREVKLIPKPPAPEWVEEEKAKAEIELNTPKD